jgi:hypothetical protein
MEYVWLMALVPCGVLGIMACIVIVGMVRDIKTFNR